VSGSSPLGQTEMSDERDSRAWMFEEELVGWSIHRLRTNGKEINGSKG